MPSNFCSSRSLQRLASPTVSQNTLQKEVGLASHATQRAQERCSRSFTHSQVVSSETGRGPIQTPTSSPRDCSRGVFLWLAQPPPPPPSHLPGNGQENDCYIGASRGFKLFWMHSDPESLLTSFRLIPIAKTCSMSLKVEFNAIAFRLTFSLHQTAKRLSRHSCYAEQAQDMSSDNALRWSL